MRPMLALAAVALATAACSGPQAGTPRAGSSSPSESTSSASAPAQPSSPAAATGTRPRDLDLSGADPCRLLTERQLAALAIDASSLRPGQARPPSALAGSPGCTATSSSEQYGYLIITSDSVGVQEFRSQSWPLPRRDVTVGGYPAVQTEGVSSSPETGSGECYVDVDVADGQLLEVQFSQIAASQPKRLPIETVCAKAAEVAAAALTTLQGG